MSDQDESATSDWRSVAELVEPSRQMGWRGPMVLKHRRGAGAQRH